MNLKIFSPMLHLIERFDDFFILFIILHLIDGAEHKKTPRFLFVRSGIMHNLLFYPHTLWMSYVTNTFLLVSSSISSKQLLCFVQGQDQKTEQ